MGTRANITIKVPTEYKGTKIKFDASKLPCIVGHGTYADNEWKGVPHDLFNREPMEVSTDYLTIYNHSDGYPRSLGFMLQDHFNTDESVLNLIAGGDISGIYEGYYDAFADNYRHVKNWQAVPTDHEPCLEQAYAYMWDNGTWYVKDWEYFHGTKWRKLSTVLENINR